MANLAYMIEKLRRRQRVRYWAIALPLVVISLALPFLRPLRHPEPTSVSDDEWVRLATIRAIVTGGTLALPPDAVKGRVTVFRMPVAENTSGTTTRNSATETPSTKSASPGSAATMPENPIEPAPPAEPPVRGAVAGGALHGETAGEDTGTREVVLGAQEPMLAVMGAGACQVLRVCKVPGATDSVLGVYLLTLILATLPVAMMAGLLYRCARLLELARSRRMGVAMACVACTGMLPYATVINPYAMAGMLTVAAMACLAQAAMTKPPPASSGWVVLAGLLAALGATVHPSVVVMAGLLGLCNLAMPWKRRVRLLGVALFAVGSLLPLAAHHALMERLGGGWTLPVPVPVVVPEVVSGLAVTGSGAFAQSATAKTAIVVAAVEVADEEPVVPQSNWEEVWGTTLRFVETLFGSFGVLSHSPALVLGMIGVAGVMLRYWPKTTRALALASLLGVLGPWLWWTLGPVRGGEKMFGAQPVVAVSPILMLWAGWLLREGWSMGRSLAWSFAGWTILSLSAGVSLLGLLHPYPRGGFATWPPAEIIREVAKAGVTASH